MARRIKLTVAVVLVVSAIPAGRWVRHTRPRESATERAHRLCSECGLTPAEIDRLIDPFSHPTLTRGPAIELFYDTRSEVLRAVCGSGVGCSEQS